MEDIFFDELHPPEKVPKLLTFDGPKCVFKATPTPVEDFLKPYYGKLPHADYTLLDRAARTFEWNALGKTCQQKIYVNPSPYYPYRAVNPSSAWFKGIWNWDSAFIMMATRRWDPELARDQMRLWMLLQTPDGMYPDAWSEGRVRGLRARGGYTVDIEWKDGKLVNAKIHSKYSGTLRVRYGDDYREIDVKGPATIVI